MWRPLGDRWLAVPEDGPTSYDGGQDAQTARSLGDWLHRWRSRGGRLAQADRGGKEAAPIGASRVVEHEVYAEVIRLLQGISDSLGRPDAAVDLYKSQRKSAAVLNRPQRSATAGNAK